MRLLVLSANEPRQGYLIRRLAGEHEIAGVIVDDRYGPSDRLRRLWTASDRRPARLCRNILLKIRLAADERRSRAVERRHFGGFPKPSDMTGVPVLLTQSLNSDETVAAARAHNPDVTVVFGTRLVKEPLARVAPRGTVNLHTGLSPYYRGGHSTFFCLYNDEPHAIGATVHWIDPGVDSGDILLTARPPLEPGDTVASIECRLVRLGTELMREALRRIRADTATGVRQWTEGRLYCSRDFTLERRLQLLRRLPRGLPADAARRAAEAPEVRLVS